MIPRQPTPHVTLDEAARDVLYRLSDTDERFFYAVEARERLIEAYRLISHTTSYLWDQAYLENVPYGFTYTQPWEREFVTFFYGYDHHSASGTSRRSRPDYGLANHTSEFERRYFSPDYPFAGPGEYSAVGPGVHTSPFESDYGFVDSPVPAIARLPEDTVTVDRAIWDEMTIGTIATFEAENLDSRYEITRGEVLALILDDVGDHYVRKFRVPAGRSSVYFVEGSNELTDIDVAAWGIVRNVPDSTGSWGDPRNVPGAIGIRGIMRDAPYDTAYWGTVRNIPYHAPYVWGLRRYAPLYGLSWGTLRGLPGTGDWGVPRNVLGVGGGWGTLRGAEAWGVPRNIPDSTGTWGIPRDWGGVPRNVPCATGTWGIIRGGVPICPAPAGSWGAVRRVTDITGAVVSGSWGVARRVPTMHPMGYTEGFGMPRRFYHEHRNVRVEIFREGRPLIDPAVDTFELPLYAVRYLQYYALSQMLSREGPAQDFKLAGHYQRRWERALVRFKARIHSQQRERVGRLGGSGKQRQRVARLPWQYGSRVR